MDVAVDRLRLDEIGAASQLLARAFAEDPILTHYLHDRERREVALPAFFEGVLEEMLPSSTVFATRVDGNLTGVAAWRPPDPVTADEVAAARAYQAHDVVRRMFPLTSGPLFKGFEALEGLHPEVSHWYLGFVGIEPACQGRGFGSHLLRPVLNVADETGTICYLETPFPRTHAFYEALGFKRHAEHHTFVGAGNGVVAFLRPAETRHVATPT